MGKPPTTDQELSARVAALEARADATEAELASLDARVTALESAGVISPRPPQPQYPIDPAYGVPEGERPDHTLPEPEPPDPEPTGTLLVAIEIYEPRGTYYFNQEDGADLGDYVDPQGRFVQRCIRVTNDGLPGFSVMFRPDADGSRQEIVFELGHIWPSQPAANMGAYEANIVPGIDDPAEMISIAVPHHNWFGRWRWQSAPRPVIAEVRDLIAAGLLPHYDAAVGGGHTPPSQVRHYAGPMDLAGIEPYMPSTGGRDDIGLVTECQADYLCTGSPQALNSLLAQLEGSGTLTWHLRDENTGAMLDVFQYPRASSYDPWNGAPDPYIPSQVGDGGGITLDPSHEPDLAYVPFLLTGDPYALEELQAAVTYNYVMLPPDAKPTYNMGGALRAHAWTLRAMARAARITPETVPQWLHSKSYFRKLLDGNRDYVTSNFSTNPNAPFPGLSTMCDANWGAPPEDNIPADCSAAPWWDDYEICVQNHLIEMGFEDWRLVYEWKVRNIIDRCSGASGWNRAWSFPYKMAVRETSTSPFVVNWADAWDTNLRMGVVTDISPEHLPPSTDIAYQQQGLAALAMAKRQGIAGAAEAHEWLERELAPMFTSQTYVYHRWSIG